MTTMTAQQLWPRFAALIHTAMSTDYSSTTFASDLSDVLDQIETHCPNLDYKVVEKLRMLSVSPYTSADFEALCEAYKALTKQYIDLIYKDFYKLSLTIISPQIRYSIELANICVK